MTKRFRLRFLLLIVFSLLLFLVACGNVETDDTEFIVSFDLNNSAATGKPSNETVTKGEYPTEPVDPELEGYIFLGWYKEKSTVNKFEFDQEITADIKLYAKWEADTNETDVTNGLTYPEAYQRVMTYIGQITDLSSKGINNYDEKNGTGLILSYISYNLSMSMQLLQFAFTASFGSPDITDAEVELAFDFLGLTNVDYVSQGNKYTLEYDDDQIEEEIVHVIIEVEYDPNTDSGKMNYYEGSVSTTPVLYLEFVKTNDGYAIQSTYGKFVFKVVNNNVMTFTVSFFENTTTLLSIFKKPNLINSTWVVNSNEASISFDGAKYKYEEKEISLEYGDDVYRINIYDFKTDGTIINTTIGEWIGIE